jgi:hypothetical protein
VSPRESAPRSRHGRDAARRPSRSFRRARTGTGVTVAAIAVVVMAGTAWACPPEPGFPQQNTQAAQSEGQDRRTAHAGHLRSAANTTAAASEAVKGVQWVGGVPEAKGAISLIFMDYDAGPRKRTVMYATGEFGLKAYDITADPAKPKLVGELNMPGMWETEDTDADHARKLIFLSRDPRAFGGNTQTGESGVYIVDASNPENLQQLVFQTIPAGHTTTCVNDCQYLWTGGPAKADSQPADWGGRPAWVTDVRDPRHPKVFPDPVDTGRNDGTTDYTHDVQVDSEGVVWASGRGGVRGYHTSGRHFDPVANRVRSAVPWNPVPYAGGGIEEATSNSSFMHNSYRAVGRTKDQAADPAVWGNGKLLYITEETFNDGCANDGLLHIVSLDGSFGGEGWRSTPDNPFRLQPVATWGVAGQEGSRTDTDDCSAHYLAIKDGVLVQSFYSQGTRFLDVTDPTNLRQVAYFRPDDAASWEPYWHGDYVYVADNTRGIDILRPAFR